MDNKSKLSLNIKITTYVKNIIHWEETAILNLLPQNNITLNICKAKTNMVIENFEIHQSCGRF